MISSCGRNTYRTAATVCVQTWLCITQVCYGLPFLCLAPLLVCSAVAFCLTFLPALYSYCMCSAVVHGIVAWLDAYGIGANDVANAFGTSVGE